MKITYVAFKASVPGHTHYWTYASNDDGSKRKLLGIVRRDGAGLWTADPSVFPPAPRTARTSVRTRARATELLVTARLESIRTRTRVPGLKVAETILTGSAVIR